MDSRNINRKIYYFPIFIHNHITYKSQRHYIMKAEYSTEGPILKVKFILENDDGKATSRGVSMVRDILEIRLNDSLSASKIHPDHLALITIMSVHPFVRDVLKMDLKVSAEFAEIVQKLCPYNIEFKSTKGKQYVANSKSRPCLAFSGGVDSTAALMLMPKDTVCAWLDRPQFTERTLYNKSAANATMDFAEKSGFEVHKVYCDVEHLRNPVGFPVDLTSGITAIAIASQRNIDSIAYGMVMESSYRTGHAKYREYPLSTHYKMWAPLFATAGIPLFLPVGGVSEVCTSIIVINSPFNGAARSCIRGEWPEPCNNCWKCFRKTLVDNRILNKPISNEEMAKWISVKEVKYKLKSWPVSHENVLAWALKNPLISGEIAKKLLKRLEGSRRDLDLLSRWYPPSIELIPEKYRNDFIKILGEYIGTMSDSEIEDSKMLDISDWLGSEKAMKARATFEEILNPVES